VAINILSTANTFGEWLNTTIDIVDTLNLFTDGGAANTFFVNTNLQIANNLTVSGNLTVTGNVTVANAEIETLNVTSNITFPAISNTTITTLFVSTDANVSGNLTVLGNVAFNDIPTINIVTANVTSLVGVANTEIYAYIEATANSANAEALAADYISLAVALG
jgi:hypothetical protein